MSEVTLLDGGMGQELLARTKATPTPMWSAQVMIDHPDAVRGIHDDYFAAGADIATTNTYSVQHDRLVLRDADNRFEELHQLACKIACDARDANGRGQVAGSLGPIGWSYRPDLAPSAENAADIYAEIVHIQSGMVDLFIAETMSSVDQARGVLMGAGVAGKPVWLGLSVSDEDGTKLRSGENLADVLPLLDEFKPAAVLINCSIPEAVSQAVPVLMNNNIPVGAYANGFTHISADFGQAATVDVLTARTDLDPDKYADFAMSWTQSGASIVGGCCEVGPAHISEIARRLGR